ncbi:lipopolysaccharide-induced tumor necrosis factor-alpha factor homolog isoform X1 [Zeugodacus cucurbitae]|uniref:lipopolysaccharide-induced tumor necrosis factor-alpha factor homolog isoform X1 n=1 Tax=Zeugodacus cucurbitae TaxID=28588 RepID=UPI0023D91B79|nr:lipopolysaccharide-induced tumor necrosis factor-alpha factor homolog isoform X1 [Zeugodacus cucurbitae]
MSKDSLKQNVSTKRATTTATNNNIVQPTTTPPAFEMSPSMLAIPTIRDSQTLSSAYAPSYTYRHPLSMHIVGSVQAPPVGPNAQELTCPRCLQRVCTVLVYEPTHGRFCMSICALLCICWPCVCVPYCMDSCQNANHYCPNCNAYIGTYAN